MKVFYKNTEISDNLNYVNINTDGAEIVAGTKFAYSTFDTLPEAYEKYILSQTDWSNMFLECRGLTSLDVSNWDTSKVTNMQSLFRACTNIPVLDVSNWNTSAVTDMSFLFYNCSALTSLDLSSFDTSKVTDMRNMLSNCSGLTSLNLGNLDTSNVTNMGNMIAGLGYSGTLDLSHFNTSAVTNIANFAMQSKMTGFIAKDWNLLNCKQINALFLNCPNLQTVDLSGWTFGNVTTMFGIFENCPNIESIDLSGWNLTTSQIYAIFRNDTKLKTITLKGCSETFVDWIKSEITQSGLSLDNITLITE